MENVELELATNLDTSKVEENLTNEKKVTEEDVENEAKNEE